MVRTLAPAQHAIGQVNGVDEYPGQRAARIQHLSSVMVERQDRQVTRYNQTCNTVLCKPQRGPIHPVPPHVPPRRRRTQPQVVARAQKLAY